MQKLILFTIGFLMHFSVHTYAQTNDKILGKWTNEERTRVIEFVKNGNTYEALIRSAEDPSLIGKKQITGLKNKGNEYYGGTLHIFQKDKKLKCSASISSDNHLKLTASYGLISKTQTWKKL